MVHYRTLHVSVCFTRATKLDNRKDVQQSTRVVGDREGLAAGSDDANRRHLRVYDDIRAVLCGTATEETKRRIDAALREPGSPESEFLNGLRLCSESLFEDQVRRLDESLAKIERGDASSDSPTCFIGTCEPFDD